ncbi:MAG: hypothetical protein HQK53_00410 [Oligoflexia bacterium]|nr:hypothetical protein [Oligoflexia bacterium]
MDFKKASKNNLFDDDFDQQQKNFNTLKLELISEYDRSIKLSIEIEKELSLLEKICKITESLQEKLTTLYSQKFPKKCNCCGRVYPDRMTFLKETQKVASTKVNTYKNKKENETSNKNSNETSNGNHANNNIHEFRNCVCGSALLIMLPDRRDSSVFGQIRRELFDLCVEKLKTTSEEKEKDLKRVMRIIFRKIIHRSRKSLDLKPISTTEIRNILLLGKP